MRQVALVALLIMVALWSLPNAVGQATVSFAQLNGTILDSGGRAVMGASISLRNLDKFSWIGFFSGATVSGDLDTVVLKDAGVRHERLYRTAGAIATRMLLLSNSVSVLMPGYRKILNDKYGRDNVHLRAHGLLARRPELPDFSRRGNPVQRILAFGKWGTYKRLEMLMEAFPAIASRVPNVKLVIAGCDHPMTPGYIESAAQKYGHDPRIEFAGYIPAAIKGSNHAINGHLRWL